MKKVFLSLLLVALFCSMALAAGPFPVSNLSVDYDSTMQYSKIEGEITNKSGRSYHTCVFKFSFYDAGKKLLRTADVIIQNFQKGETVTFDGMSTKNLEKAKSYKVRLDTSM